MRLSPADRHIIVNYHYIEEPRSDRRGIHPCPPAEFERQIEFLRRSFSFGTIADVFAAAQSESDARIAALTFDDCLRSQYENAAPILARRGIPATFFPITSTFAGILPPAHKIHFLRSAFGGEELIDFFNGFLAPYVGGATADYRIPKDARLPGQHRPHKVEDLATANFKEMLLKVPGEVRDAFFRSAFRKLGVNEEAVRREFFMSPLEIRELAEAGFVIGNHSHWHFSYGNDDGGFLSRDVELSTKTLEELIGKRPIVFSYPHGYYTSAMAEILEAHGFHHAVTIESRAVRSGDGLFTIPRFDTNALKSEEVI